MAAPAVSTDPSYSGLDGPDVRVRNIDNETFGTGTVLNQFGLSDGSALLLATQEWLTPAGRVIWHKGIAPDVQVSLPANTAPPTKNTVAANTNYTITFVKGTLSVIYAGTVTDSASGGPLDSVRVYWENQLAMGCLATTDSIGRYSLGFGYEPWRGGSLIFSRRGYRQKTQVLPKGSTKKQVQLDLKMARGRDKWDRFPR